MCNVLEIVQVPSKCDLSPFDCLHLVDVATRKRCCSRQLNVLLSSNAVLKGNIVIVVVYLFGIMSVYLCVCVCFLMIGQMAGPIGT